MCLIKPSSSPNSDDFGTKVRRIASVVTCPPGASGAVSPWPEQVGNPVRPVTMLAAASAGISELFGTKRTETFLLKRTLHSWYIHPRMEWQWEMHTPEPGL